MERTLYQSLLKWKNDTRRKPLVIKGARQVGKTWLMKEFGKREFESVAYINFEKVTQLADLFQAGFDVQRMLRSVQLATGVIPQAGKTLIIFDEIQTVRRGLLALKYFYEESPQYHVMAAGSLLGMSVHPGDSFPVGKVDFLNLYPLSFHEFLMARAEEPLLETLETRDWTLIKAFRGQYVDLLRHYYYTGGMPEVVDVFVREGDFAKVRMVQNAILESYDQDFSKYPPLEMVPRIKMVWNAIPSQLAKENRKFIYGALKPGGRAKEFELAIMWLQDAGLIHKVNRVSNASLPLGGFEDTGAFKLFMVDVGLLGAKSGLDARTLINGNELFTQYKGALTEQYVHQQLKPFDDTGLYYWTPDTGMAEIDFLLQHAGRIVPVEVKAEENLKAKSLQSYRDKYHPAVSVRTSMSDYREEPSMLNMPLYAIGRLIAELDSRTEKIEN